MLPLIAGALLLLVVVFKLIAIQSFASGWGFFIFINSWFIWLFAFALLLVLYSATRRIFYSLIISAIVTFILRLVFKT